MNRREFILGATATAGLAATAAPASKGKILFGACAWTPSDAEILKSAEKLRKAGYDFIELAVGPALDPTKDDAWWEKRLATIRKAALPVRSCNGFLPGTFRLTGPAADFAPALKYAETALRRADAAGVKTIVFGSGGARNVPGDFCGPRDKWPDLQKGAKQYADFCRELCKRVADLSVKVVIEPLCPNESNIVNFVWQGRQICEDVGSPRLGVLADLFHMTAGREGADSIVAARAHLGHCHVAEVGTRSFPGADPKLTPQLKPYFDALRAIGYAGGVSCECGWGNDYDKNITIALKTLKELAS